jgi:hypothetical protein
MSESIRPRKRIGTSSTLNQSPRSGAYTKTAQNTKARDFSVVKQAVGMIFTSAFAKGDADMETVRTPEATEQDEE